MASPARKPPPGTHIDTADILVAIHDLGDRMERRFERVDERVQRIETDLARVEAEQRRQGDTQRKQGEDISEIKGQIKFMPTIWTLAALIFAIFGASFVLIRFASGH